MVLKVDNELLAFVLGFALYMVMDIFDVLHLWLRKKFKKLKSEEESKFFEE